MAKRVLYFSASIGLGHVGRDLAIARELRARNPGLEIHWIAAHPATLTIEGAGETLHPDARLFGNDSAAAEKAAADEYRMDIFRYCLSVARPWWMNVKGIRRITARERYDLVVADEAYELALALRYGLLRLHAPFAMIYDFVGYFATTRHPADLLLQRFWNREWSKVRKLYDGERNVALFVGEPEDVPDKSLGLGLPTARDLARELCHFLGHIVSFDPEAYRNREKLRAGLGYGDEPLVLCSIGGSAIGKQLLELCGRAYPLIRKRIPELRMVLVSGPRLDPENVHAPPEVEIRGYVPRLHEHLAACDLAVVQGGGSTTLELAALRRPFLYVPLENHFEQQIHVAGRLARLGAGIKVPFSQTGPGELADLVVANLGQEVIHPPVDVGGAARAAEIMTRMMDG